MCDKYSRKSFRFAVWWCRYWMVMLFEQPVRNSVLNVAVMKTFEKPRGAIWWYSRVWWKCLKNLVVQFDDVALWYDLIVAWKTTCWMRIKQKWKFQNPKKVKPMLWMCVWKWKMCDDAVLLCSVRCVVTWCCVCSMRKSSLDFSSALNNYSFLRKWWQLLPTQTKSEKRTQNSHKQIKRSTNWRSARNFAQETTAKTTGQTDGTR